MWLPKKIWSPANQGGSYTEAMEGQVSLSHAGEWRVVSAWEHVAPPLYGPGGYHYCPTVGERMLLLPVAGEWVALGCKTPPQALLPGEVCLTSAGGACLHLKEDGSISLNGLVITKEGQILPKEG